MYGGSSTASVGVIFGSPNRKEATMEKVEINDAAIVELISNKIASGVYESSDVVAYAMLRALPLLREIAGNSRGQTVSVRKGEMK
jgi:hypothetical protein